MKTIFRFSTILIALLASQFSFCQNNAADTNQNSNDMKTYVIERDIPEIGKMTAEQLKGVSKASCNALNKVKPGIEWVHSYVTDNKTFCVYRAESEAAIREHAKVGDFPITAIYEQSAVIGPETAKK